MSCQKSVEFLSGMLRPIQIQLLYLFEKIQSAPARGIEKIGGLFGGNLAREARSKRIAQETQYLDNKDGAKTPAQPTATPTSAVATTAKTEEKPKKQENLLKIQKEFQENEAKVAAARAKITEFEKANQSSFIKPTGDVESGGTAGKFSDPKKQAEYDKLKKAELALGMKSTDIEGKYKEADVGKDVKKMSASHAESLNKRNAEANKAGRHPTGQPHKTDYKAGDETELNEFEKRRKYTAALKDRGVADKDISVANPEGSYDRRISKELRGEKNADKPKTVDEIAMAEAKKYGRTKPNIDDITVAQDQFEAQQDNRGVTKGGETKATQEDWDRAKAEFDADKEGMEDQDLAKPTAKPKSRPPTKAEILRATARKMGIDPNKAEGQFEGGVLTKIKDTGTGTEHKVEVSEGDQRNVNAARQMRAMNENSGRLAEEVRKKHNIGELSMINKEQTQMPSAPVIINNNNSTGGNTAAQPMSLPRGGVRPSESAMEKYANRTSHFW